MSWLLFMDESGHDHKNMPFEVRGGIAIHARSIWNFIQKFQDAEYQAFGIRLSEFGSEIKGSKLLQRDRYKWASQMAEFSAAARHAGVRRFLTKKTQKEPPTRRDFTAYGQANLLMAHKVFGILEDVGAVLFASLIERGMKPPPGYAFNHFLRKDHIFLQERFFYFLERHAEHGVFIMDQTEKQNDRRFVARLQDYYIKTQIGRQRTQWIIPYPLFVDSELSVAVQAADLCLYCINWGFRIPAWNWRGPIRNEIARDFGGRLSKLQFAGDGYRGDDVSPVWSLI